MSRRTWLAPLCCAAIGLGLPPLALLAAPVDAASADPAPAKVAADASASLGPGLLDPQSLAAPAPAPAIDYADPPIGAVQRAALVAAGLDPERLHGYLGRARWAGVLPQLRLRVVRDTDRDGRTTVRFSSAEWIGDLAAVDTRGDGLRLQGEAIWPLANLVRGPDELAALKELRAAAAARRALLQVVTAAYFDRRRALLDRLAAADPEAAAAAELAVASHTALLDGLTGGAFSREVAR